MIEPRITILRTAHKGGRRWLAEFNLYKLGAGAVWIDTGCVSAHGDSPQSSLLKLFEKLGHQWPEALEDFTDRETYAFYRKHHHREEYDEQPSLEPWG